MRSKKLVDWMKKTYSTYKFDEVGLAIEVRKWGRVLSRLSDIEIKRACMAVRGEKYAPNEERFVNKAFGIMDSDNAFYLATKYAKEPTSNKLEDPLVYYAYCQIGTWAWKNKTDYYLNRDFNVAYADAVQKVLNRENLDIPVKNQHQIEHKKEDYKQFKSRIAIEYGTLFADKHCIHKDWGVEQCQVELKKMGVDARNLANTAVNLMERTDEKL